LLAACGGEKKTSEKAAGAPAPAEAKAASMTGDAYTIDMTNSQILWTGSKPAGKHMGTIGLKGGTLYADKNLNGGEFTIDMTSIQVTDLEGEKKASLEAHLLGNAEGKEDHFFNVEKFPTAGFKITNIKAMDAPADGKTHVITGDLTIRDKTETIEFPASVVMTNGMISASALDVVIDRTKYGVNYGSKSIFDDLGDKFIDDEIVLNITLSAKK
jgi:Uncharacterized conserved protein